MGWRKGRAKGGTPPDDQMYTAVQIKLLNLRNPRLVNETKYYLRTARVDALQKEIDLRWKQSETQRVSGKDHLQ